MMPTGSTGRVGRSVQPDIQWESWSTWAATS